MMLRGICGFCSNSDNCVSKLKTKISVKELCDNFKSYGDNAQTKINLLRSGIENRKAELAYNIFLGNKIAEEKNNSLKLPKKVIFNNFATIVYWEDGSKTVVKCSEDDDFDKEKGFLMAYFQKHSGMTKSQVSKFFKCDEFMEVDK